MTIIPDDGIKKTTIFPSAFPPITKSGKYILRYRIVSEDKTSISAWSSHYTVYSIPVYSNVSTTKTILNPTGSGTPVYTVSILPKTHGENFDISWKIAKNDVIETPSQLDGIAYDAYVRWGNDSSFTSETWEYVTTTSSNSFSLPIPNDYKSSATSKKYAQFMVHISTTTKDVTESNLNTRLFLSDAISTEGIYDSSLLS